MPNENGVDVRVTQTGDPKEIQKIMRQAAVTILVGFPSGMQHVPTLHRRKREGQKGPGNFEDLNGNDPMNIQPVDTAELAKQLHYGTAAIPARPFMEDAIKQNAGQITAAMRQEAEKIKNGQKPNWKKVGTMAVGAITEFVRGDYYKQRVPNSPRTIEYKGSDHPLIDGANMIQSLTFRVEGEEE